MTKLRLLVLVMFASLALLPVANAQTSSATITGILTDPSGGAIVGATVTATNDLTKLVNEFKTDSGGRFQFQVTPGDYTIHVAQSGFKAFDTKVNVVQEERFDMHEVKLTVGDVATSVEVEGEIAHVQTDSSDKTIAVNDTQIQDTPSAGRNFLDILRSLPGTAVTTTNAGRGGTGGGGNTAATVNGGAGQMLVTLNGIASQDSGAPGTGGYQAPSVDAIGEVQVMVSNYTAEYGARNGGQMNVTIKNGTNQFHGTAYYYYRHEEFDANEWYNNHHLVTVNGIPGQATSKPLYRYQNPGGTIGGPLFIPKKFNRDRNKLFFFYSDDELAHKGTNGPNNYLMPTALERAGNFSQTTTSTGVQVPIYDPLNNQTQFTNNTIPASRISAQGYALLNLFPLPNLTLPTLVTGGLGTGATASCQCNYTDFFRDSLPETDRILRIDAPLGKKTSLYVSGLQDYYATFGVGSLLQASGAGWGQFLSDYGVPNVSLAANVVHTFKPNLINEFTVGTNRAHQIVTAENAGAACPTNAIGSLTPGNALPYSCSQLTNPNLVGPNGQAVALPNLFPGANTLNTLPNVSFGTGGGFTQQSAGQGVIANTPSFGFDTRWPFSGTDYLSSITNNVTWIKGTHTVKAGFYLEHDQRTVSVYNEYNTDGTVYFGTDRANTSNDTNYPYANADLGSMFAYGADNKRQVNHSHYTTIELFLQDTWKVSRRLTLDYGLRMQSIGQEEDQGASLGFFNTASYNPATVGQLLFPACTVTSGTCPNADKVAENPKTHAIYPYALVNTFDPASYANNPGGFPWSGAKFYTTSFWNRGKPDWGPRIGFAYDLFGNGKTAIRGGFGIFYGRASSVDQIAAGSGGTGPVEVAPNFLAPAYVYPTFTSLSGVTAAYAPQTIYGGTQNILNPQTIQWSGGIQHDLGKGTILDVSYLGWVTHHGYNETQWDLNTVPLYTDWKPTPGPTTNSCGQVTAYLDPTASAVTPGTCTGGAFLNSNLIRGLISYEGWSGIDVSTNKGESNYNSMQVQFNKRFGKRLQFGANYTWSKALSYGFSQDLPDKLSYNVTGNRPQVVNVNFGYRLQNGTNLLPSAGRNYVTKLFLDGWNLNGVLSFYDGTPSGVSCGVTGAPIGYWTGTPVDGPGTRCQLNGSAWLPAGSTPATTGSTSNANQFFPLNAGPGLTNSTAGFVLPGPYSLGLGNAQPTIFYGPGFDNQDLSVFKQITLGKETRVLEFRAEAFNTFNHFNPSNPSTSLTYNFATGAQTNANFGSTQGNTSGQNTARHMALSLRLRF